MDPIEEVKTPVDANSVPESRRENEPSKVVTAPVPYMGAHSNTQKDLQDRVAITQEQAILAA